MIPAGFEEDGYVIIPGVVPASAIERLAKEADRLRQLSGSACLRNIRAKSKILGSLTFHKILPQG